MDQFTFKEWITERDQAVSTLNANKLKAFIVKWQERGVYNKGPLPSDHVLEVAVNKMAMEITTIDKTVKERAAAWLLLHNYYPGIRTNELDEKV